MDTSDGYIGISKHYEERMKQHHRDAFVRNSIYTVHEKMRMYGEDVITSKIFEGSINECFDYEEELRPRWHMGWNMAIGGGRPGSGWKPNPLWLDNRLWHSEHGEVTINKNMTVSDMEKKFLKKQSSHTAKLLMGTLVNHKGWELANSQLVERVKSRYYMDWKVTYISNGIDTIKLNKSGFKAFAEYLNIKPKLLNIKFLVTGTSNTCRGYKLISEQEWLETTERLEFK